MIGLLPDLDAIDDERLLNTSGMGSTVNCRSAETDTVWRLKGTSHS